MEDYPEVCNYLRSLVGEPPLEKPTSNSDSEDLGELDPTNQMTKDLIDQVRDMMTDAEANGIDSDSPELDLRLRELVSKTIDQSVGLGKLIAANGRNGTQPTVTSGDLEAVVEGDEAHTETQIIQETDQSKRRKT